MSRNSPTPYKVIGLFLLVLSTSVVPTSALDVRDLVDPKGSRVRLEGLADSVATAISRSLIVPAASGPVSYVFDVESGAFVREQGVSGQLFLERPKTIGRGRWSLIVGYQHYAFDTFDGKSLDDLRDPLPFVGPDRRSLFFFQQVKIDIVAHQTTFSATYGLTDAVDLSIMLPLLYTSVRRHERVRILSEPRFTGTFDGGAHATGVGDIVLRAKLALLSREAIYAAAGLGLRLPSGDESDFHGTGSVALEPYLYASRSIWEGAGDVGVEGLLNAGMVLDTYDVGESEGRWAVGVVTRVGARLGVETAVLGRHAVERLVPEGFLDFRRCLDGPANCSLSQPAKRVRERPLFGFDGARPDYFDFAFGVRLNAWAEKLFVFAGVLVPLNDPGLRTEPAPACGIEGTF